MAGSSKSQVNPVPTAVLDDQGENVELNTVYMPVPKPSGLGRKPSKLMKQPAMPGRKKKLIVGIGIGTFLLVVVIVVVAVVASGGGGGGGDGDGGGGGASGSSSGAPGLPPGTTMASPQTPPPPPPPPAPPLVGISLPPSSPGELIVLSVVATSGAATPVARSYDGNDWEAVMPTPATVTCYSGNCATELSGDTRFDTYTASARTSDEIASRFLAQASFGPTTSSLQGVSTTSSDPFSEWVQAQMALPATLHREHHRKRANVRWDATNTPPTLSSKRAGCAVGTRWHQFALTRKDVGKTLSIVTSGSTSQLLLDGSDVRAETTDLSGWTYDLPTSEAPYVVCAVDESVGGSVTLGGSCSATLSNPQITLVNPVSSSTHTFASGEATLTSVAYEPGVGILTEVSDTTCAGKSAQIVHLEIDGTYYALDERLETYSNTLTSPSVLQQCSTPVGKTWLNEATCVPMNSSCGWINVCGSPGEVANDPVLGGLTPFLVKEYNWGQGMRYTYTKKSSVPSIVWTDVVLAAADQLRQRTAWALSQIIVVGDNTVVTHRWGRANYPIEAPLAYYDIFVRHAFGSYLDVLKEVSRSPHMGKWLSSEGNSGYHFTGKFPDENFGRELMQLFTIGLHMLHPNGTLQLDAAGAAIETYDAFLIQSCARVWTGFVNQPLRSNQETADANPMASGTNIVDPMRQYNSPVTDGNFAPSRRDPFPKSNLIGGYIGDTYPLCKDLPVRSFLRAGAKFNFLGSSSVPLLAFEWNAYNENADRLANVVRLGLDSTSSALYAELCHPGGTSGACQPQSVVVLPSDLSCHGEECEVDTAVVVKLESSDGATMYYEYVPPACVSFAFFNSAVEIARMRNNNPGRMCGDPTTMAAVPACCNAVTASVKGDDAELTVKYHGEKTTYATNEARCVNIGQMMCDQPRRNTVQFGSLGGTPPEYAWTSKACSLKVQVHSDGLVGIIHEPGTDVQSNKNFWNLDPNLFKVDNVYTVRAAWSGGSYPVSASSCGGVCTVSGRTCVCDVTTVTTTAVFTDDSQLPSLSEVTSQLHIGSLAPDSTYTLCTTAPCSSTGEVQVYKKTATGVIDIDTIFKVTVDGAVRYLLNKASSVSVGGSFAFRNMPQFMSFPDSSRRDAEYESDAWLDHLVRHQNTAPFIAHQLIQRLVTSNPSPRYVQTVGEAFRTGTFGGRTYSGAYGDLGATVAAVLLDQEARSVTLDADPSHGKLREPLVMLVHFLRSMEFSSRDGILAQIDGQPGGKPDTTLDRIGQEAHYTPSVFNFYYPDYQPMGVIADAGLYAPEAQLATPHFMLRWLNGMLDLVNYGLNSCRDGLSVEWNDNRVKNANEPYPSGANNGRRVCRNANNAGSVWKIRQWADGNVTFSPQGSSSTAVVDELDLLLTAGRLNDQNKIIIQNAYESTLSSSASTDDALRMAQYLFLATSEFHATNDNALKTTLRSTAAVSSSAGRALKSVIVLYNDGGLDSFNMLVPHSDCSVDAVNGLDMFDSYTAVRGTPIALSKSQLLEIDVPAGTQPCSKFGVHNKLPFLKQLYDDGDAAFIANMGTLIEPLTDAEIQDRTKPLPPFIASHNTQMRVVQKVYAQDGGPQIDGVVGRIMSALNTQASPYKVAAYSTARVPDSLRGPLGVTAVTSTQFSSQPVGFESLDNYVSNLTSTESTSLFAETYSDLLQTAIRTTDEFPDIMNSVSLTQTHTLAQTEQISRLIGANDLLDRAERAGFAFSVSGFDSHKAIMSEEKLETINTALTELVNELKSLGVWENTVIVQLSDFGRTLDGNGQGTDHGWGGNYFVAGGGVRGGQILGTYPASLAALTDNGKKRGRVVPTTPWEAVWQAVAEWLDVDASQMSTVLPNAANFGAGTLLTKQQLFDD